MLDFRVLGTTSLRIGDHFERKWGSAKTRGLLAVLLTQPPGGRVPVDLLAEWLWGDGEDGEEHRRALQGCVSKLRRELSKMDHPAHVEHGDGAYWIDADRSTVDYHRSRNLLVEAHAAFRGDDVEQARSMAAEAVDLWQGLPLADISTDLAKRWRRRARENELLPGRYLLLDCELELGEFGRALGELDEIQPGYDLDPRLAGHRLRALHGLQRHDDGVAFYINFRKRFQHHTGASTPKELDDLFTRLFDPPRQHKAADTRVSSPEAAPHRIPPDIQDFTGRSRELEQLDGALAHHRKAGISVLDGPAGTGKTALAVRWAHLARKRFPDGVFFTDLRGFSDSPRIEAAEVIAELLDALGVATHRMLDTALRKSTLRKLLDSRQMLIILDNAFNTDHIRELLELMQGCQIVVTSRRRLDGLALRYAPRHITLAGLSETEAEAWLRRDAGARSHHEPHALHEIIRLCANIPIVLRLAGRHLAIHSHELLADLGQRLRQQHALLRLGAEGKDQEITVAAAFSWSYKALTPEERNLFRLLGLHPGKELSLGAASALAGHEGETTRALIDSLVEMNLMHNGGKDQYRFHDLCQSYAADLAGEVEPASTRRAAISRLMDWYLHSAYQANHLVFPHRVEIPMDDMEISAPPERFTDAEDATRWCLRERSSLVAMTRLAARQDLAHHGWRLPNAFGEVLKKHGFYSETTQSLEIALDMARKLGDRYAEAETLGNLANIYLTTREYTRAQDCLRRSYKIFSEIDDLPNLCVTVHNMATHQIYIRNIQQAVELCGEALDIARKLGDQGQQARTLYRLGQAYRHGKQYDRAVDCYNQALWIQRAIREDDREAKTLTELAKLAFAREDDLTAESYCTLALEKHGLVDSQIGKAKALRVLADVCCRKGAHSAAVDHARAALRLSSDGQEPLVEARSLESLGDALYASDDSQAAVDSWRRAKTLLFDLNESDAATKVSAKLASQIQIKNN